ncbi:MAG: magnesium chelatase [Robiginitomaculum sp.]|nr:MAG: magnesium chelatase [Robiginitomaculum sp.]
MNVSQVKELSEHIKAQIALGVIGQKDTINLLLVSLFAGGHILLEGPPGTAKTFLAQCFANVLSLNFGRIQFTPDLMPGDLLGTNLFDFQTNKFSLIKGPIFCDLLLADEINRTPPKTQAALLEAMQERQITIDGTSYDLGAHFMVIATQNPIEQQGTYPLPEAQLDRFLFKHNLDYPNRDEEIQIVTQHGARTGSPSVKSLGIKPTVSKKVLQDALNCVANVKLTDDVIHYVVDLIRATRENPLFETGASPRAAAMLAAAARANAALDGRDFVLPDDVKSIALPALRHRVILSPVAEIEGRSADELIREIIEHTSAPR